MLPNLTLYSVSCFLLRHFDVDLSQVVLQVNLVKNRSNQFTIKKRLDSSDINKVKTVNSKLKSRLGNFFISNFHLTALPTLLNNTKILDGEEKKTKTKINQ